MGGVEHRHTLRFDMIVQVSFKAANAPDSSRVIAQTDNISSRGVYFRTDKPLSVGTTLQVLVRMPKEIAGLRAPLLCCMGRVVHIRLPEPPIEASGMGVEFYYYDVISENASVLSVSSN
ncbi:MAG: PilZ domain-containing protein [Candidatus Acidiferrales bacterium]